jgi:hypothetical protein
VYEKTRKEQIEKNKGVGGWVFRIAPAHLAEAVGSVGLLPCSQL